ncbi:urease subunit alpha [Dietzia timorensis]|uniref:Urease subunit alpha n=1 Tax=Dietzia timorensis TaxID=499555 RepID=A0A173LQ55_9ACTN|nr:urease subunit alpha [Dietzia timorensis]ANI94093.1 Urease subunit alpha [Dietzia timorensis]
MSGSVPYLYGSGDIELHPGRETVTVEVLNTGDRAVQVGSHYHFFESNRALRFDRAAAYGMHLAIGAGLAVRFEPGTTRTVALVPFSGSRVCAGFAGLVEGSLDDAGRRDRAMTALKSGGFEDTGPAESTRTGGRPPVLGRRDYVDIYGPTVGDRVPLADTCLTVSPSIDYNAAAGAGVCGYGDEAVYGGGKAIRDGMAQDPSGTRASGALDLVITGGTIIDAVLGVVKGDIGVRDGKIVAIGKAGNPGLQDGVHPGLVIGPGTEVASAEHCLVTAGGVDTHIHFIAPQQVDEALSNGVTTLFGGGTGPAEGTKGTTCTPGEWNIHRMLEAAEGLPVNIGILGKGNSARPEAVVEQIRAGAAGLKIHEDWGSTPQAIRTTQAVADEYDVQVAIHTDTLNEGGFYEDTAEALGESTIHTFHSEGAGGGHAPDILRVCGEPNVLPASTNPTLPYTTNSVDELLDMVMVCHHLSHDIPEDVSFADSRVRAESIAAETVMHDEGIISIFSSDSQAMGRIGESWARAFQTAHHCRVERGPLPEDNDDGSDNERVLRYAAKMTINPAIAAGISEHVGSIEPGKLADIVIWPADSFAAKPKLVIKGGAIVWAPMGDPNASLPTPQPVIYRPMFGAYGKALTSTRVTFMSQAAIDDGIPDRLGLDSPCLPVRGCRGIGKKDMVRNDRCPDIEVDPETYVVRVDGEIATIAPARTLPLSQLLYMS